MLIGPTLACCQNLMCIYVNTCGKNCEVLRPQLPKIYGQVKEMPLAQHKKTHSIWF